MGSAPVTSDFWQDCLDESRFQDERWPERHDAQKTDADWFWLVGFLAGKVMRPGASVEKKRHRLRALAAVLEHWDRQLAPIPKGPTTAAAATEES